MPKVKYKDINFRSASLEIIHKANAIIKEYDEQGFQLTLRQLYYQFVSRDYIENNLKSYKNLGNIINDARLAGRLDWSAIVDRTRELVSWSTWSSPAHAIESRARVYQEDLWDKSQGFRPEVWIEKDALVGVIEDVCCKLRIPYFSCRGFTSQSEMWAAAQRLVEIADRGQTPVVIHLGDHDPSGIDMSRDIFERLSMFGADLSLIQFERIALNYDQVQKYRPPPNFAKATDSRFGQYRKKFGTDSWELDALEPRVIAGLIESTVLQYRDEESWEDAREEEKANQRKLYDIAGKLG